MFLQEPQQTPAAKTMFDDDLAEVGFVMNASRLWAYEPDTTEKLFDLIGTTATAHGLHMRERGILIAACASAFGDSYCSIMWGNRLANATDADTAAAVLRGDHSGLTESERAIATWARRVATDPNGTTAADVQELRDAGLDDERIFGITVFVALRLAFSTINDALGARPDAQLRASVPPAVLDAVDYGRAIQDL